MGQTENRAKKTGKICAFLVICIVINFAYISVLYSIIKSSYAPTETEEENGAGQAEKFSDLIEGIKFQKLLSNKQETDWEFMLNEGLLYYDFSENKSLCELRTEYYDFLSDPLHVPAIDLKKLYQFTEKYYGTILPLTELTLEEITEETPPLQERMQTDINIYKNETYIRAMKCKMNSSPSGDMYYQTARAADDVVKLMVYNSSTLKERIFFSYIAVNFYLLSIPYEEKEVTNDFIYDRIAQIYIHLYKYCGYEIENNYKKQFLISAEVYLHIAGDKYYNAVQQENINSQLPEYGYNYACVLNDMISIYGCNDKEIRDLCVEYAQEFMDFYGSDHKYYSDCYSFCDKYSDDGQDK